MRVEKENDYSSFSKILNKIDAGSLGEQELRMIKQEHSYLEKLRQQRVKIEQLKKKYDESEAHCAELVHHHQQLEQLLEEKDNILNQLDQELQEEVSRRENAQKQLQRYLEQEKGKSKAKTKELEQQNQELKKILRQKQISMMALEDQLNHKLKFLKDNFLAQKKSLLNEYEEKLKEAKSKYNDGEVSELRNLVARQNKALKLQNEKYQEVCDRNDQLTLENEELQQIVEKKTQEIEYYEERLTQLTEQMEEMQERFQQQSNSNKLKGQLDEIRKKMNQLQKGEIERIEFIVNEMQ